MRLLGALQFHADKDITQFCEEEMERKQPGLHFTSLHRRRYMSTMGQVTLQFSLNIVSTIVFQYLCATSFVSISTTMQSFQKQGTIQLRRGNTAYNALFAEESDFFNDALNTLVNIRTLKSIIY